MVRAEFYSNFTPKYSMRKLRQMAANANFKHSDILLHKVEFHIPHDYDYCQAWLLVIESGSDDDRWRHRSPVSRSILNLIFVRFWSFPPTGSSVFPIMQLWWFWPVLSDHNNYYHRVMNKQPWMRHIPFFSSSHPSPCLAEKKKSFSDEKRKPQNHNGRVLFFMYWSNDRLVCKCVMPLRHRDMR